MRILRDDYDMSQIDEEEHHTYNKWMDAKIVPGSDSYDFYLYEDSEYDDDERVELGPDAWFPLSYEDLLEGPDSEDDFWVLVKFPDGREIEFQ